MSLLEPAEKPNGTEEDGVTEIKDSAALDCVEPCLRNIMEQAIGLSCKIREFLPVYLKSATSFSADAAIVKHPLGEVMAEEVKAAVFALEQIAALVDQSIAPCCLVK